MTTKGISQSVSMNNKVSVFLYFIYWSLINKLLQDRIENETEDIDISLSGWQHLTHFKLGTKGQKLFA